MSKNTWIAIALGILAALGFVLFFTTQLAKRQLTEQEIVQQQRITQLEAENLRLANTEDQLRAAEEAAARNLRMSEDARRMAESKATEDQAARQKRIDELNALLERQAAERLDAERQAALLNERMEDLLAAQQLAQQRLTELEQARSGDPQSTADSQALQEDMRRKAEELENLRQENSRLRERQQLLLANQIETEDQILREGGEVRIHADVRSPNFRRREALLLRTR